MRLGMRLAWLGWGPAQGLRFEGPLFSGTVAYPTRPLPHGKNVP